jgi:hypothetical protein
MATAMMEEHPCVTPNCGGKAKLRCPNCVKLGRRFHWIVSSFIEFVFQVYMMDHIFARKIVLKVIGKNIKNYMYKPVWICFC